MLTVRSFVASKLRGVVRSCWLFFDILSVYLLTTNYYNYYSTPTPMTCTGLPVPPPPGGYVSS